MALRWQWEECIGELEIENQNKARIKVYLNGVHFVKATRDLQKQLKF